MLLRILLCINLTNFRWAGLSDERALLSQQELVVSRWARAAEQVIFRNARSRSVLVAWRPTASLGTPALPATSSYLTAYTNNYN